MLENLSAQCSLDYLRVAECKEIAAKANHPLAHRQALPSQPYTMPDPDTRLLCAQLIYEEMRETLQGLGIRAYVGRRSEKDHEGVSIPEFMVGPAPDMEAIIDGCCDLMVVVLGTLAACGVPDVPHMDAVCEANLRKFPGGVAIIQYLKIHVIPRMQQDRMAKPPAKETETETHD